MAGSRSICSFLKLIMNRFLKFLRRKFSSSAKKCTRDASTTIHVERCTQTVRRNSHPRHKRRKVSDVTKSGLSCHCHRRDVAVQVSREPVRTLVTFTEKKGNSAFLFILNNPLIVRHTHLTKITLGLHLKVD